MKKARSFEEHCSQKSTYFTMVTNNLPLAGKMMSVCLDCKSWAYITHEPDTEEGSRHVHFLVGFNGSRSVKQVADKFGIEPNYCQPVTSVVGFRRYMLHLDSEEKIQYKVEDVHTNCHADFRACTRCLQEQDSTSLFEDYLALRQGRLDPKEFINRNQIFIDKMSFYQKLNTIDKIYYIWGLNDNEANAST